MKTLTLNLLPMKVFRELFYSASLMGIWLKRKFSEFEKSWMESGLQVERVNKHKNEVFTKYGHYIGKI